MNDGGESGQDGFWLPQDGLVPDAVEEGWVLFETDTDTTKEDLQVRCGRNDIRASWEYPLPARSRLNENSALIRL